MDCSATAGTAIPQQTDSGVDTPLSPETERCQYLHQQSHPRGSGGLYISWLYYLLRPLSGQRAEHQNRQGINSDGPPDQESVEQQHAHHQYQDESVPVPGQCPQHSSLRQ